MSEFFLTQHRDGVARTGVLELPYGSVETPVFMPVGTAASVKSLLGHELIDLGYNLILANTYHLALRPGEDLVAEMGGLRKFSRYDGNILTDSGGYQVFSLAQRRKIEENAVVFQSHIDGSKVRFTPSGVLEIQRKLGAQIVMPLDVCPPGGAARPEVQKACSISRRWYEGSAPLRSLDQELFAIIQGGTHADIRRAQLSWAKDLSGDLAPSGISLGGYSVGEPREDFWANIEELAPDFPKELPVYAMGIGDPRDLVFCATQGVDMFDCVLPTRNARNGRIYAGNGYYNIKRAALQKVDAPLAPGCGCAACSKSSVSYVRHLFRAGELSYFRLATMHNLWYFADLMQTVRQAINENRSAEFNREFQQNWQGSYSDDYLASLWK